MSIQSMPKLWQGERRCALLKVVAASIGESAAAAVAALATRALFVQLHEEVKLSTLCLLTLAVSGLFIALLRVFARTTGERLGQSYIVAVRRKLFLQASKMSADKVEQRRAGYMSLRFVGDMGAFNNWLAKGLPQCIAASALLPSALWVMAYMHLPFLYVMIPAVAIIALIFFLGWRRMPQLHQHVRTRRAAIAADMAERMPIAPYLGSLGRRNTELSRIERRSRKLIDASISRVKYAQFLRVIPSAVGGVLAAAIVFVGFSTGASASTIAAALAALGLTLTPVSQLANALDYWAAYGVAREKCEKALNRPLKRQYCGVKSLRGEALSVVFNNVSYDLLHAFNAKFRAGECVRLTDSSGVSRSVLLPMLAGYKAPESGEVLLAGLPISQIAQGSSRRRIAYLSDDLPVLRGSLRKALTLGIKPRPKDDDLLKLVSKLGWRDLLVRLGGLDGRIPEGARGVSRADQLKISVLRAMLGKPALILVDQSVSYLDENSQDVICQWLRSLSATVLAIDVMNVLDLAYQRHFDLDTSHSVFAA